MKVAFLSEYYRPFEIGGAERSAERLAIELGKAGTPVTVFTPNYGAPVAERIEGIDIVRLPFPQRLVPGALVRRIWAANPVLQVMLGVRMARRLRREGVSIVHVQNSGMLLAGALASRLAGVPLVVTVRDLAYLHPGPIVDPPDGAAGAKWRLDRWWAGLERRLKRRALGRASSIVFVSQALRDLYMAKGIAGAGTARVVYNIGPEPAATTEAARDRHSVLFVGKLSTGKGLQVLYAAAERIAQALPEVRFILAGLPGVGYMPPPAQIEERVRLTGRVDAGEVRRLMQEAGVLVAPAIWPEPLSRVLLEAMTAGLPVVASRTGGNLEALGVDQSGVLVPPGDSDALAAAVVRVLRDQSLAARLAAGGRQRVAEFFSPAAVVPLMHMVYRDARHAR